MDYFVQITVFVWVFSCDVIENQSILHVLWT